MTTYIAKPNLFNTLHSKEFNNAYDAVCYLNKRLAPDEEDDNYKFTTPKVPKNSVKFEKHLKNALEDYVGIGKIVIKE